MKPHLSVARLVDEYRSGLISKQTLIREMPYAILNAADEIDGKSGPMKPHLSPRQRDVLDFLVSYIKEHEYPPTIGEIAKGLRINSRSTVHSHLWALKAKGYISIEPGSPRAIRIVA